MLYVRGDQEDYNSWERKGNPGWSWEGVLPYFRRSEDQQSREYIRDTKHHGTGGPLPVGGIAFKTPLADAFLQVNSLPMDWSVIKTIDPESAVY